MSTTKFMTATGSNRELHIKRSNESHVQIRQFDPEFHTHQAKTFFLNPSDAPALALAILEAAGVEASFDPDATYGTAEQLGHIQDHLHEYVKAKERATAEAKEQAELEAEALELYNVCMTGHNLTSFDGLGGALRDQWLAVARRAREMRAEK